MAAPFRAICAFHHLGIRREFFLRIPRDCTSSELDRDVTKLTHRAGSMPDFGILQRARTALDAINKIAFVGRA
jgi:hypothetical protein